MLSKPRELGMIWNMLMLAAMRAATQSGCVSNLENSEGCRMVDEPRLRVYGRVGKWTLVYLMARLLKSFLTPAAIGSLIYYHGTFIYCFPLSDYLGEYLLYAQVAMAGFLQL